MVGGEKKALGVDETHVHSTHGHFRQFFLHSSFLPILRRKLFGEPKRKHLGLPSLFPLPLPTKHPPKKFSFSFSLLFFFLPPKNPLYQTS